MGKALLMVIAGFGIIFSTVSFSLHSNSGRNLDIVVNNFQQQKARNAAHSAANIAVSRLYRNYQNRSSFSKTNFNGCNYQVSFIDNTDDESIPEGEVIVRSIAEYNNYKDTIEVRLRQDPFSKYAFFTSVTPSPIYFITGDTIFGPMHSNDMLYFSGQPVFYGRVTSSQSTYGTSGYTNPQFMEGAQFGVPSIPLPTNTDAIKQAALNGGDLYTYSTSRKLYLTFKTDGTYDWSIKRTSDNVVVSSGNKSISSYNGVIMADGCDVYVKGTIKGKATVTTTKNIYIDDDIKYNTSPYSGNAVDMLGLVADQNVIVSDNTANRTNCEINASIMAINGQFTIQNYDQGSPRGKLIVYGGILQKERGPVGKFGSGGVITGYIKKYYYDDRFASEAPPYYPYEPPKFVYWKE
jgi:hypothetical protein